MGKAIPLILVFVVLHLLARCDQHQAIQRSRMDIVQVRVPVEETF